MIFLENMSIRNKVTLLNALTDAYEFPVVYINFLNPVMELICGKDNGNLGAKILGDILLHDNPKSLDDYEMFSLGDNFESLKESLKPFESKLISIFNDKLNSSKVSGTNIVVDGIYDKSIIEKITNNLHSSKIVNTNDQSKWFGEDPVLEKIDIKIEDFKNYELFKTFISENVIGSKPIVIETIGKGEQEITGLAA